MDVDFIVSLSRRGLCGCGGGGGDVTVVEAKAVGYLTRIIHISIQLMMAFKDSREISNELSI